MFCYNCGKKITINNAKYCSYCGVKLTSNKSKNEVVEEVCNTTTITNKIKDGFNKVNSINVEDLFKKKVKDATIVDNISKESKVYSSLSYIGLLVFIPYLLKKDDEYVRFHIKEGFNLLLYWLFFFIIKFILSFVKSTKKVYILGSYAIRYVKAPWTNTVVLILLILMVILIVVGIINALSSNKRRLPIFHFFN